MRADETARTAITAGLITWSDVGGGVYKVDITDDGSLTGGLILDTAGICSLMIDGVVSTYDAVLATYQVEIATLGQVYQAVEVIPTTLMEVYDSLIDYINDHIPGLDNSLSFNDTQKTDIQTASDAAITANSFIKTILSNARQILQAP